MRSPIDYLGAGGGVEPSPSAAPDADALTDRQRRDVLAHSICARLCDDRRTIDEVRVIDIVLGRLEIGADRYGGLRLATDTRDWRAEAAEEVVDMAIYNACDVLRRRDERIARIECEAADESHRTNPIDKGLAELRDSAPALPPAPFDVSDAGEEG